MSEHSDVSNTRFNDIFRLNAIFESGAVATAVAALYVGVSVYFQGTIPYDTVMGVFMLAFYVSVWHGDGFLTTEPDTELQKRSLKLVGHPMIRGVVVLLLFIMFLILVP